MFEVPDMVNTNVKILAIGTASLLAVDTIVYWYGRLGATYDVALIFSIRNWRTRIPHDAIYVTVSIRLASGAMLLETPFAIMTDPQVLAVKGACLLAGEALNVRGYIRGSGSRSNGGCDFTFRHGGECTVTVTSRARGKHLVVVAAFWLETILDIFPEELVGALLNSRPIGGASTDTRFIATNAIMGESFATRLRNSNSDIAGDIAEMSRLGRILDGAGSSILRASRVTAVWFAACLYQ
jgi:hypothetical protein